jgi:hypothetical protein
MSQLVKTKRQANFKDFKRFGAFRGLVDKKMLYSTRSCVNWAFFRLVSLAFNNGPLVRKISLNFDHNFNLFLVRRFHIMKKL